MDTGNRDDCELMDDDYDASDWERIIPAAVYARMNADLPEEIDEMIAHLKDPPRELSYQDNQQAKDRLRSILWWCVVDDEPLSPDANDAVCEWIGYQLEYLGL